jgi:hypothetical protein
MVLRQVHSHSKDYVPVQQANAGYEGISTKEEPEEMPKMLKLSAVITWENAVNS